MVRNYLKERGLGHLLNDLIAKYDSVEEIDLQKLPNRFVLKATHGSGWNIICKEKKLFDWSDAQKKLKRWMYDNYYFHSFEWPYKEIKPRIICEKFLQDEKRGELLDYKFMCFNGKVRCLFVCSDRHSPTGLKVDFYDLDWNIMPFYRYYPNSGKKIDKPKYLSEMVKYAEILSKPFPFVRVDFYEIEGNIIFGELTFFPGSGMEYFRPQSYDYVLGSWITLPSKQL